MRRKVQHVEFLGEPVPGPNVTLLYGVIDADDGLASVRLFKVDDGWEMDTLVPEFQNLIADRRCIEVNLFRMKAKVHFR